MKMEMKMEKLRTRLRRDMTNSILYYIHSSLRIFYFWISIHSLLQRGGAGISSLHNMWYESILHILYQLSFLTDLYLSAPPGFVLYITDSRRFSCTNLSCLPLNLNFACVPAGQFKSKWYEESPRGAAWRVVTFLVTSNISPELISCAIELRFYYVGVRAWGSKLRELGRGHEYLTCLFLPFLTILERSLLSTAFAAGLEGKFLPPHLKILTILNFFF